MKVSSLVCPWELFLGLVEFLCLRRMCWQVFFSDRYSVCFCVCNKKFWRSVTYRFVFFRMNVSGLVLPYRRELRSSILFLSSIQGGTFSVWRGVILRKPIRDNPKIFTKFEKNVLKSEKIFQIVMFFGNHRWRVYQIWKTITNLNKIIESTNIIL